jgi:hypothetical protein
LKSADSFALESAGVPFMFLLRGFVVGIVSIFIFLLSPFLWAGLINIPSGLEYPLNSKNEIEFCWLAKENSSTRPLQKKIENYFKEQLQDKAQLAIHFTGLCLNNTNPMAPIGIAFYDAPDNSSGLQSEIINTAVYSTYLGHPTTYSRGLWAYKNLTDIVLTSHFKNVAPTLIEQMTGLSKQGLDSLLMSIALHESLHALGIAHEHDRADSTCLLEPKVILDPGLHTYIGAYDSESIMNYCKTRFHDFEERGPIRLSEGDVQTLRSLYVQ